MGRPLQPNPVGGPPAVPQALNRYGATSLGPPGVAEGVRNGYNWLPDAFGIVKDAALDFASLYPIVIDYKYIGQINVTIEASKHALTKKVPEVFIDSFGDLTSAKKKSFYKGSATLLVGGETEEGLQIAARRIETVLVDALPSRNPWTAEVLISEVLITDRLPQYARLGRAIVSGGGSAGIGILVGEGLVALGCSATVVCGITAGVAGILIWGVVQPVVFDFPIFAPADRNLRSLQVP